MFDRLLDWVERNYLPATLVVLTVLVVVVVAAFAQFARF